jgi:hypothetical protein
MEKKTRRVKLGIVVLVLIAMVAACKSTQQNLNQNTTNTNTAPAPTPTPTPASQPGYVQVVNNKITGPKSTFDHFRDGHKQLTNCGDCHQRDKSKPTASVPNQPNKEYWQPYHDACNRCHTVDREQYGLKQTGTTKSNTFCAGCHQDPPVTTTANGVDKGNLLPYPNFATQFGIRGGKVTGLIGFSHKTHMDASKMTAGDPEVSCNNCHNVSANPTRATFPKHEQCFQCHVHQSGQAKADCTVCHVKTDESVRYSPGMVSATNYKFRHSQSHLRAATCSRCHQTLDLPEQPRVDIQQISTARGQRHSSACWQCHSQAKETVCSKCHTSVPFR